MEKMNQQSLKSKAQKSQKQTVPAWADADLIPAFEKMLPHERVAAAERLEWRAAQLREMKPAPVKSVCAVTVQLSPKMKEAIIAFACQHEIDKEMDEKSKLENGAHHVLQVALRMIAKISDEVDRQADYRKFEGVQESVYCERLIGDALAKWNSQFESDSDED